MPLGGIDVIVTATWVTGWRWTWLGDPRRTPPRLEGRKGTRRQWKRAHPHGWRWRHGPVEPDHVLEIAGKVYCTAAQYAALKAKMAEAA